MTKQLVAIWAEDEKHLIGVDNHLPWRLPKELKHFKEMTMGQVLVMGRKTFDGMQRRILPGRETIILSRDSNFIADDVLVLNSVEQVLDWYNKQDKTVFIVGGASIYQAFAEHYDAIIKTTVHGQFEGDTHFPEMDLSAFKEVERLDFDSDEKNAYAFTVQRFEK